MTSTPLPLALGTRVRAQRWDLFEERLVDHLGVLVKLLPHDSGMCYLIRTTMGVDLDVLASLTHPIRTLDDWMDAIEECLV